MKYRIEVIINLPRKRVVELFDNTENMYKWQPGLVKHEFVSGTPGELGSKMKLYYVQGKKKFELIETITKKNLPDEFNGTYEGTGLSNEIRNQFIELGQDKTKWLADIEFRLTGFMKIIGWVMPGAFKKQSEMMHARFKSFAENEK